jgi:hypothetical protein
VSSFTSEQTIGNVLPEVAHRETETCGLETDAVYPTDGAAESPLDASHSGCCLLRCQATGKGDFPAKPSPYVVSPKLTTCCLAQTLTER